MSITDQELILNDLVYGPITDPSVQIQRQLKARYPDKSSYKAGEKMTIKLDGSNFLDMKNSSLYFKFTPSATTGLWSFGNEQGSALNLFNRVRVVAPGGKASADLLNSNAFNACVGRMKQGAQRLANSGDAYGFGLAGQALNTAYYFNIPMHRLSPLFQNEQLLPPDLADGMIIEFYLETAAQAFSLGTGASPTYTIDQPTMYVDTTTCSDSVTRAVRGMDWTYEFTDVVQSESFMSSTDQQIYYEVPQSLTNAVEAFAILRVSTDIDKHTINGFRMKGPLVAVGAVTDDDQMEWSIGSTKLPQQGAMNGARIYNVLLNAQGVTAGKDEFNIQRNLEFSTDLGVYSCDLRRSRMYANSGRELSDGQRLVLYIKQSTAANYVANIYVYYQARIVMRGGRIDVER